MAWGKPSADGNPAAELISKARTTPSLHILPFRAFGDAECVALFAALRGNRTLTELRASGHALGVVSLQALGALLASGDECAIRHLAIGNASLGGAGVSLLCDALGDSHIALHTLDLGLKGLGAPDADALGRLLRHCPQLRHLELGRNPLGVPGARVLATPGVLSLELEFLGLCDCALDGTALDALTTAATTATTAAGGGFLRALRTLHVASNPSIGQSKIGLDAALGRLLGALPALTVLDAHACELGEGAAAALALAIASHGCLLELQLANNPGLWLTPPLTPPPVCAPPPPTTTTTTTPATLQSLTTSPLPTTSIESALPSMALADSTPPPPPPPPPPPLPPKQSPTAALVAALRTAPALRKLCLGGNALRDEVAVALGGAMGAVVSAVALGGAPKSVPISEGAVGALPGMAPTTAPIVPIPAPKVPITASWSSLTELDARSNRLGVAGAAALVRLGAPLLTLSLFDNPAVGGEARDGGRRLADALRVAAPSLHTLDIGACGLDDPSHLAALTEALRDGGAPGLKCLEVFGNGAAEESGSEWREALTALREVRSGLDVAWKEPDTKAQPG